MKKQNKNRIVPGSWRFRVQLRVKHRMILMFTNLVIVWSRSDSEIKTKRILVFTSSYIRSTFFFCKNISSNKIK